MEPSEMIAALEAAGDYKVLRRLKPRDIFNVADQDQDLRVGVLIDLETTGLDVNADEVIEIGMVKFTYLPQGQVVQVVDTFVSLNEPIKEISAEISDLTGITPEMVVGHRVDGAAVAKFVSDAVVVIAHNAAFD